MKFCSWVFSRILPLLVLFLLPGCAWLFGEDGLYPDRSNEYLESSESASIVLPETVDDSRIESDYPVPELALSQVLPEKFEIPRVEPLDAVESQGSVRVQKLEGEQWILMNTSPSQAWPLVKDFLVGNGIRLEREDGRRGILQTGWLSIAGETFHEKYRIALQPGVQQNSTEITVLQLAAKVVDGEREIVEWGQRSTDAMREDNMVNLLAEYLASAPGQASHSLLAQGIGSASKVTMHYSSAGSPYLQLELPFDRAWAALGLALEKASYQVQDLDRSSGTYYVQYQPINRRDKKPGFFGRLFGGGNNKAAQQVDAANDYVVEAQHNGELMTISVRRATEPALQSNEKAFILKRIQGKIS